MAHSMWHRYPLCRALGVVEIPLLILISGVAVAKFLVRELVGGLEVIVGSEVVVWG